MFVERIVVGMMETNCYIAGDEKTGEVFIIDPGSDHKKIKNLIKSKNLTAKAVVNTHGHGDHIGSDGDFGLPVWIHELDAEFLQDPSKNLSGMFGFLLRTKPADRLLKEGDVLKIGNESLEVIHTPGHTPGGISLKGDGIVFTGDTLFCEGIGRTDFAYGSEEDIITSIKEKLFKLADDYVVYPGHGPTTTIGNEKKNNPFID